MRAKDHSLGAGAPGFTNTSVSPRALAICRVGEYLAFTEGIRSNGTLIAGEALQPTPTATTVRVRNGKTQTTDGPFAET
jgi:hypothetical protein